MRTLAGDGEKVLERLSLSSHAFDINSAYSSVPCKSIFPNQGSFSGPGGFNSNPVGTGSCDGVRGVIGIDGTSESIIAMPSAPSGVWKRGRLEDMYLKIEEIADSRRMRAPVALVFVIGSGAILTLTIFGDRGRCYRFGGSRKKRAEQNFE